MAKAQHWDSNRVRKIFFHTIAMMSFGCFTAPAVGQSANLIPNSALDGPYYIAESRPRQDSNVPCDYCIPNNWGYSFYPSQNISDPVVETKIGTSGPSNGFSGNYFVLGGLGYDPVMHNPGTSNSNGNFIGFLTITPSNLIPLTQGKYVLSFDVLNPVVPPQNDPNYITTSLGVHAESYTSSNAATNVSYDIGGNGPSDFYDVLYFANSQGLTHVSLNFNSAVTQDRFENLIFTLGNPSNNSNIPAGNVGDTLDIGNFSLNCVNCSTAVPESRTWTMMLAGFALIGFAMRKRPAFMMRIRYA